MKCRINNKRPEPFVVIMSIYDLIRKVLRLHIIIATVKLSNRFSSQEQKSLLVMVVQELT
jgi:hypothetical protein